MPEFGRLWALVELSEIFGKEQAEASVPEEKVRESVLQ